MEVMAIYRASGGFVGGRGFSCLSLLASDKSLELVRELFRRDFEVNSRGTGSGGRWLTGKHWDGVPGW